MGLILDAFSGAAQGGGQALEKVGMEFVREDIASRLKAQEAAAMEARDARLEEFRKGAEKRQEEATIRSEERQREPYKKAAEDAQGLIGTATAERNPVANDDEGNPMPKAGLKPEEEARLRAGAYERAGLPQVASGLRTEGLQHEKLALEKSESESRAGRDVSQHQERMLVLNKQLANQDRQIQIEDRKLAMLEKEQGFKNEDAKVLRDARKAYMDEKDPDKKLELGAQYLTLSGKVGERWKPIESVDPASGQKTVTGFFDSSTARLIGPEGRGGAKGGRTGWDSTSGMVLVNGVEVGVAKTEKEAREMAAKKPTPDAGEMDPRRFSKTAPAATKADPITGERLTKDQFDRKFGKGQFDKAG